MNRCLILALPLFFVATELPAQPASSPAIRIQRDSGRGLWGVETTNARLDDIARALSRSMGCSITVDENARDRRLDTLITPRTPERLIPLLGRRANMSATLTYRFDLPESGEAAPKSPAGFGKSLIAQELREPLEIEEAARTLRLPVELGQGVEGKVRLNTLRAPIHRVLDQIAAQSRSRWTVVIKLKARSAADAIAAREEEPRFHYSDLAQLTPEDRREEIEADLARLQDQPEDQRSEAVNSLAENISGMFSLVREAQENRGTVAGTVSTIARDYDLALGRFPSDNRAWAVPLFDALRELSLGLRALQ